MSLLWIVYLHRSVKGQPIISYLSLSFSLTHSLYPSLPLPLSIVLSLTLIHINVMILAQNSFNVFIFQIYLYLHKTQEFLLGTIFRHPGDYNGHSEQLLQ